MMVVSDNHAERRAALSEQLADHMLAHGLLAASLRPLAKAAGTSDRMLLYYFADKQDVIGTALQLIAARMTAMLDAASTGEPRSAAALLDTLAAMMAGDAVWPYLRLFLEVASRAGQGDPLYRAVGEGIGRGFLDWIEQQLLPGERAAAPRILVTIEGMLFLRAIGMGDVAAGALPDRGL